jgi:hypothetical protein
MRKFIVVAAASIAAMVLASASAQAADSRSLSTTSTVSEPVASNLPKSGKLRAETDATATPAAIPAPPPAPVAEIPRYAPPPAETPKAIEAPKPVDTTRNTESPATARRYNARPAAVDTTPPPTATPYRQQSRQANYRRSQMRQASFGRPHYRVHRWNTGRIIAALHRYGIYW